MPYKSRNRRLAGYSYNPRESFAKQKQKAYQRITVIVVAILVILLALLKNYNYIIELIVGNESSESTSEAQKKSPSSDTQNSLVWKPSLDTLPEYTKQPKINITGTANYGKQVDLIFNGDKIATDEIDTERKFEFTDLNLKSGENTIAIYTVNDAGEKSDSAEKKIILDMKPPELAVESPTDKASFGSKDQKIMVSGQSESGAKTYVNDHIVILNGEGKFSYQVTLKEGENTITVRAIDQAENETKVEIKVTFDSTK